MKNFRLKEGTQASAQITLLVELIAVTRTFAGLVLIEIAKDDKEKATELIEMFKTSTQIEADLLRGELFQGYGQLDIDDIIGDDEGN
jgi:hypothetical protein